jgi:orotidine-5'-phosphate decarboxylase
VSNFGARLEQAFLSYGQLCVGIDPSSEQLSSWGLPDSAEGAREFAFEILEACANEVGIIKPQVAFFEQFGQEGLAVLSEVLHSANSSGLLVIADAKRGDIGSSMAGYTRAWLSKDAAFQADALTLSPFLGLESLRPTIDTALANQKGVFLLAATSNPESAIIQRASTPQGSIASAVASFASSFSSAGLGSVGLVVGATVSLKDYDLASGSFQNTPILMPGFGAQGVALGSTRKLFGDLTSNLICSVSRSVAGDSRVGLRERIFSAKQELNQGVLN